MSDKRLGAREYDCKRPLRDGETTVGRGVGMFSILVMAMGNEEDEKRRSKEPPPPVTMGFRGRSCREYIFCKLKKLKHLAIIKNYINTLIHNRPFIELVHPRIGLQFRLLKC